MGIDHDMEPEVEPEPAGKKKRGRKAREVVDENAFRLADYTEKVATLHYSNIRLDERKVFGQVLSLSAHLRWLFVCFGCLFKV